MLEVSGVWFTNNTETSFGGADESKTPAFPSTAEPSTGRFPRATSLRSAALNEGLWTFGNERSRREHEEGTFAEGTGSLGDGFPAFRLFGYSGPGRQFSRALWRDLAASVLGLPRPPDGAGGVRLLAGGVRMQPK